MRAGRKRNPNVIRDASGKSRGEPSTVSAEVRAVRERQLRSDGINPDEALNSLAGFTLGRLLLRHQADKSDPGSVTRDQYDAGTEWLRVVCRYSAINGFKHEIHSPGFAMVGGTSTAREPEEDEIARITNRWRDCHKALMDACRVHGIRVHEVTRGVVCENWPTDWLDAKDYGDLRTGLNALRRVL